MNANLFATKERKERSELLLSVGAVSSPRFPCWIERGGDTASTLPPAAEQVSKHWKLNVDAGRRRGRAGDGSFSGTVYDAFLPQP